MRGKATGEVSVHESRSETSPERSGQDGDGEEDPEESGQGLTIHPLVASVSRWLRFGNLNNGVDNAGLSCGNGNNGLTNANWNIGGRFFERNE